MEDEVPHRVYAEHLHQLVGIDDVALTLAHLAAVHQQPGVAEHLLRQGQVQRHEEDGPVDGVEPDDVLADEVQVRGPQLLKLRFALLPAVVADAGDVVGQSVQPHVHHVLGVELHRDAPGEAGAGHAQVLQARQQEVVHHLVLPGHGLDELRVIIDIVDEPGGVLAHLEEVGLLLGGVDLPTAVGALAVHQLALGPEALAGGAVQPLVRALVDVTLVVEVLEDLLDLFLVVAVGGADEVIVGHAHQVELLLDDGGHLVHELLGGDAFGLGLQLVFLAVLVGAGLEEHVIALQALEPGDGVRQDDLVHVADVGLARRVGDGGGEVIFPFAVHSAATLLWKGIFAVSRRAEKASQERPYDAMGIRIPGQDGMGCGIACATSLLKRGPLVSERPARRRGWPPAEGPAGRRWPARRACGISGFP